MTIIIHDNFVQGSDEWLEARRGVAWKWVNPTVEPESPLLRPSKRG